MDQYRIGIACNRLASGGGMESHARSIITELANQGFTPVIFTKNHKDLDHVKNCEIIASNPVLDFAVILKATFYSAAVLTEALPHIVNDISFTI